LISRAPSQKILPAAIFHPCFSDKSGSRIADRFRPTYSIVLHVFDIHEMPSAEIFMAFATSSESSPVRAFRNQELRRFKDSANADPWTLEKYLRRALKYPHSRWIQVAQRTATDQYSGK
jgi:hypothetical protein